MSRILDEEYYDSATGMMYCSSRKWLLMTGLLENQLIQVNLSYKNHLAN